MKNLGIFYLILIVLFSIMPCADEVEAREVITTAISKPNHKDLASEESCSPICLCACCGQTLVAPVLADFQMQTSTIDHHQLVFSYHFKLEQRAVLIWQPPKLV